VNLFPEFGVSVNLVRHVHWLGANNEFHNPFLLALTAPNRAGTRNHPNEALWTAASLRLTRGSSWIWRSR